MCCEPRTANALSSSEHAKVCLSRGKDGKYSNGIGEGGLSHPAVAGNKSTEYHSKNLQAHRSKRQKDRRTPKPRGRSGPLESATAFWRSPVLLALWQPRTARAPTGTCTKKRPKLSFRPLSFSDLYSKSITIGARDPGYSSRGLHALYD